MYNSTQSHRGSALLVGLIIVVLLTILTTSFLEKILGLGRTSGAIGNSAQAYTLATGLVEEQLMQSNMTRQAPWNIQTRVDTGVFTGRTLSAYTGGNLIPEQGVGGLVGKGNSEFDKNWNTIALGEPVQIVIPENVSWGSVSFRFRVANIPGSSNTGSASNSGIILWTFGSSGASLYASGEMEVFRGSDITGSNRSIAGFNGITSTGSSFTFNGFYADLVSGLGTSGAKCNGFQCTLKLSMIRPFLTLGGQSFSFLEYQIEFPLGTRVPSQYMVVDSTSSIYGYIRSRQVRIPQITSNTATDFAVLQ
ncbi:hypothetical protein H7170_01250 [Candidatus Gracilibacteria bacterium]|nr:hypothetical protein [Candidatus Gracilibacteria bacterium]